MNIRVWDTFSAMAVGRELAKTDRQLSGKQNDFHFQSNSKQINQSFLFSSHSKNKNSPFCKTPSVPRCFLHYFRGKNIHKKYALKTL